MPKRFFGNLSASAGRKIRRQGDRAEAVVAEIMPLATPTGKAVGHDFLLQNGEKLEVKSTAQNHFALFLRKGADGKLEWRNDVAHHVVLIGKSKVHFVSADALHAKVKELKLSGKEGAYKFSLSDLAGVMETRPKQQLFEPEGIAFLNNYFGIGVAMQPPQEKPKSAGKPRERKDPEHALGADWASDGKKNAAHIERHQRLVRDFLSTPEGVFALHSSMVRAVGMLKGKDPARGLKAHWRKRNSLWLIANDMAKNPEFHRAITLTCLRHKRPPQELFDGPAKAANYQGMHPILIGAASASRKKMAATSSIKQHEFLPPLPQA